jgi:hypothetical protein
MLTTKEICFAISTFQCVAEYDRCVQTIPKDSFIMQADGAYPDFAEKWIGDTKCRTTDLISSDGTTEVIHKAGRKGFVFSFIGPETQKRQALANKVAELGYRYMFIIDSDEYIHSTTNWNAFLYDLELKSKVYLERGLGVIFDVNINTDKNYVKGSNIVEPGIQPRPRLWVLPDKLEYFNDIHNWVRRRKDAPERYPVRLGGVVTLDGLMLYHDSKLRTERYLEARAHCAKVLLKTEREKQNEHLGFPKNRHAV